MNTVGLAFWKNRPGVRSRGQSSFRGNPIVSLPWHLDLLCLYLLLVEVVRVSHLKVLLDGSRGKSGGLLDGSRGESGGLLDGSGGEGGDLL